MVKGYNKQGIFEGMNTWQLLQKVYSSLVVESKSLVTMIGELDSMKGADKTMLKSAVVQSDFRIKSVLRYLDSLLVEGDEFSSSMASLYDWYVENLNVILNDSSPKLARDNASKNLVAQAEGFVSIWKTVKND